MSNETGAVVIAEGTEYELLSSGDGAAFVLRFKTDQLTAHLRGDDAIRFRADYEALKMQYPAWQADQRLRSYGTKAL